ncbi:putative mitochondrial carrier [Cyphellophora attinorum]|uniref:Putative mitochondrial carrier n=1 Tax=Cyphellophora attinorum TaxID=1664694 RepID=A0A0N0NL64_9EURO|nr:putative mitochondrial carrier [Phialophora attinorum]KPI38818.1 putative mitochondrial carrier [Phialophora attinorum]
MTSPYTLDRDAAVYWAKYYRQGLATAPATVIAICAGSPFENAKVRMQSKYFPSALDATKYMYRTEGLRGFWVGTWAPLASLTVTRTISFSIYRRAKYQLDSMIESVTGSSPLQHVNRVGSYPNLSTVVCFTGSGMIAGAALVPFLTPIELIKNCTQSSVLMAASTKTDPKTKNAGRVSSAAAARQIIRERGFLGLFTGFRLHFYRDVAGTGLYFGIYETLKQTINSAYGADKVNAPGAVMFAGAACGVLSWTMTYPLDSMKTQAQNRLVGEGAKRSMAEAASAELRKTPARSFSKWKGLEMVILRSALQNMIQMSLFEYLKERIDALAFSNGSRTLPEIERELGRDQRRKHELKEQSK